MILICVGFISKHFSFNCTTKHGDFTASYKFRSLKHFISRGDFKPSNERVQTDKRQKNQRDCIADLPNNKRVIPRLLTKSLKQI